MVTVIKLIKLIVLVTTHAMLFRKDIVTLAAKWLNSRTNPSIKVPQ